MKGSSLIRGSLKSEHGPSGVEKRYELLDDAV